MKKRIICMLLLALTLCGCESNPAENSGTESSDSSASDCEVPDRDAETLPAETETPAETAAADATLSPEMTASGAESAETDVPEQLTEPPQEDVVSDVYSDSNLPGDLLPRDDS